MIRRRSRVGGWPIAAVVAVIALVLYAVRFALIPFVFAAAVAFVVDPLIAGVHRRVGGPRWLVASLLCLVLFILIIVPACWVVSTGVVELSHIAARGPQIVHNLVHQAVGDSGVRVFGKALTADKLASGLLDLGSSLFDTEAIAPIARSGATAILAVVLTFVLIPYFMITGHSLAEGAVWLLPPERRRSVRELLPRIVPVLRRYLVGIFLVVAYTTTVGWIGFGLIFDLQHAVLLAAVVGVLELVPVIGPICSVAIVGLTALQESSLWIAGALMAFAIVLRLSIDNLVGPLVLGRAARVPAVVVMFSFVCGGMLFGVVGLLLAVPVATCIKTILGHYYAEPIKEDDRI